MIMKEIMQAWPLPHGLLLRRRLQHLRFQLFTPEHCGAHVAQCLCFQVGGRVAVLQGRLATIIECVSVLRSSSAIGLALGIALKFQYILLDTLGAQLLGTKMI